MWNADEEKMIEKIQFYLKRIEAERNIKILLACETGSRAWGFPSPDSDYDVRIIYVKNIDWYLSVSEQKDSIELMLENNDLDITGWELRKCLRLLGKSNASLLERIQSPIIYTADEEFLTEFYSLANKAYSKIATMHHYLSMSKKIMEELRDSKEYRLKKFFYALRTALICKWISEKEVLPPIEFGVAVKGLDLDPTLIARIEQLIVLKFEMPESYMHSGESELLHFIDYTLEESEEKRDSLHGARFDMSSHNQLLKKYVLKYDN